LIVLEAADVIEDRRGVGRAIGEKNAKASALAYEKLVKGW